MTPNLRLPWSLDEDRANFGPENLDYIISQADGGTIAVPASHGEDPEAKALAEAIIERMNLGLTTREPETSIESQTFIDTGRKPFVCFIVTRENQSDRGYVDTDVLDVFTTEADAKAEAIRLEAEDLLNDLRVSGREEEWPVLGFGDGDWQTSYKVIASTLRGLA